MTIETKPAVASGQTVVGDVLTLGDVTEWLDRLARTGPGLVIDAGRYGIELVGSDAEDLARILESILNLEWTAEETFVLDDAGKKAQQWDAVKRMIGGWSGKKSAKALLEQVLADARLPVPDGIPWRESLNARQRLNRVRDSLMAAVDLDAGVKEQAGTAIQKILDVKFEIQRKTIYHRKKRTSVVLEGSPGTAGLLVGGESLERQVERAMAGALNRTAPGGGAALIRALRETYPIASAAGGGAALRPGVERPGPASRSTDAFSGTYASPQAVLVRQTNVAGEDALRILAGLTPTSVTADLNKFEDARRAVGAEINGLMDEARYATGPRLQVAENFLLALVGDPEASGGITRPGLTVLYTGHLGQLASAGKVTTKPDTFGEERFYAGLRTIAAHCQTIIHAFVKYFEDDETTLLELVARALQLLPILRESNDAWQASMSQAGVSDAERQIVSITEPSAAITRLINDEVVTAEIDDLVVQLNELAELPTLLPSKKAKKAMFASIFGSIR